MATGCRSPQTVSTIRSPTGCRFRRPRPGCSLTIDGECDMRNVLEHPLRTCALGALTLGLLACAGPTRGAEPREHPYPQSELDLKAIPFKIVYETYRETGGKVN